MTRAGNPGNALTKSGTQRTLCAYNVMTRAGNPGYALTKLSTRGAICHVLLAN